MRRLIVTVAAVSFIAVGMRAAATLDIYFIDVEGGQATLIVTPERESLLVDTGYPERRGRDPDRIMAAVKDARLTRIDYLLITHFHEDHDGGAAELALRIPIGTYVDYGSPIEATPEVVAAFARYSDARKNGKHLEPKPGARLPLRDVDVEVVSAGGATLSNPLSGAGQPNAACATFEPRGENPRENPRSIGIRVRYGRFRFFDLGDLVWNKLGELVCPTNLIGGADVYLVAHHGNGDSNVPAVLAALRPRVAVVNNGMWKGGTAAALDTLHHWPGLESVWQLHLSGSDGAENSDESFIANLVDGDQDVAYWIKLRAGDDGRFNVTNGRTGFRKDYGRLPHR